MYHNKISPAKPSSILPFYLYLLTFLLSRTGLNGMYPN